MIKNYFRIALRILTRNKVFSLINILGLSVALTSVLIIFLFVSNELGFDKHHSKYPTIYRIVSKQIMNSNEHFDEAVPVPLSAALNAELTGHEDITQIYFSTEQLVRIRDEKYLQTGFLFADSNFTKIFDVELITGNSLDLRNPNTVYLSEELALKFFGSVENALDKELVIMDSMYLNVVGIIKNTPKRTHIPFKAIISMSSLSEKYFTFKYNEWGTNMSGFSTYLTISNKSSVEGITANIQKIVEKYNKLEERDNVAYYFFQPLSEIHLDDRFSSFKGAYVTSRKFLWIFSLVGLFILLIAYINFTNLSIVQTIRRAKEVGIRKVLGADRSMLIRQFLGETLLILFLSEVFSLIFTEIVLDKINIILGHNLELHLYTNFSLVLFLIIVLVSLTFLSGFYPATILSRYNPIKALRYNFKIGRIKTFSLYNFLIVLQFFISQVLIVSAIIISLQIEYIKNKDLGFTKNNVIMINLPQGQVKRANSLIELLNQNPDITKVSLGIGSPIANSNITSSFYKLGDEQNDYSANIKIVDSSYFRLYNLKLLYGEVYKNLNYNDSTFNIVVNKSLVQKIGIDDPANAIDQYIKVFGSTNAKIVGIVEDFHTYSLHNKIPPVIFMAIEDYYAQIHILTNGKSYSELKTFLEKSWDTIFPEYIYTYEILEDRIKDKYLSEYRMAKIIKIFTFIAIIIACLGLYGLVSYIIVQRVKEVGIRKAMGASISSLVFMVSKQFIGVVIFSCIIAWPAAYYIMTQWLNNYAFKIDIRLWIFLVSGILLVSITFLTIFYQAFRVSNTNPAEVLKYE